MLEGVLAAANDPYPHAVASPNDPSFRALSGRLKFTVRRHKFNKYSLLPRNLEPAFRSPKPGVFDSVSRCAHRVWSSPRRTTPTLTRLLPPLIAMVEWIRTSRLSISFTQVDWSCQPEPRVKCLGSCRAWDPTWNLHPEPRSPLSSIAYRASHEEVTRK